MKSWRLVVRVDVAPCCDQHFGRNCTKKISSSSLMVGICHLTDSHHYHHGQKPTRVGICHGGNMLGNRFESFISCSSKSFFHTFYWQSFNQKRSVRRPLKSFPRKQYKPRWVKLLAKCGLELGNKENLFLPTFVFANSSFSKVWIKFQRSYQGRTILKSSSALDLIRQNQTKNQSRRISGFAEVLPRH